MAENYVFKSERGLSRTVVEQISEMKGEPDWMRKFRLKSLDLFEKRPMPTWGADLSGIDFDNIFYYIKPVAEQGKTWDDIPADIKDTFDRLGIPQAEQKYLAGVTAQYESEAVYHKVREDLEKIGVIFTDMDTALRLYPDIIKEHFGTIIPPSDNKFASLNSAVWSGGSFVYVPEGVRVEIPLQAYFRINAQNMGQFERTLIIAAPGSYVHYVEGCTAPTYASDSLHSAVVEIKVMEGARVRYTTIQNWSKNVYNLVTKRAAAYRDATMEWVDGNLGSKVTMKYPAVLLMEPGAEVISSQWPSPAMACSWMLAPRSPTWPRIPLRKSSRNRSRRGLAEPRIAAWSASTGVRTTPNPMSAVTRSCSMRMPAPTPTQPFVSKKTRPRSATRRPSRRSVTTSSST